MDTEANNGASCQSRLSCSPCLFIWGGVLLVAIIRYFVG